MSETSGTSGFDADLDAIAAAAGALRATVDTVATAAEHLDAEVCARVGPGRLGGLAARLTDDTRRDLDRVLGSIVEDADLVAAAGGGYAERDRSAAGLLSRLDRDTAG